MTTTEIDLAVLAGVGAYHYTGPNGAAVSSLSQIPQTHLRTSIARLTAAGWVEEAEGWTGIYTTNFRRTSAGNEALRSITAAIDAFDGEYGEIEDGHEWHYDGQRMAAIAEAMELARR